MEEEKKDPLEELYAPPTETGDTCSERRRQKTNRSAGFYMDLSFSAVELGWAILSVPAYPGLWEFFGQPIGRDTIYDAVSFPLAAVSALGTAFFPLIAVPVRIVTAFVTAYRKTASWIEYATFFAYVVVSVISYMIANYFAGWFFYIT